MVRSFSLSLAAIDILFEHLELDRVPFPFEVPHLGKTFGERAQIRRAVFDDLESRGLTRGGRLDADVERALTTFARGPLAITAAANLEQDTTLFARSATDLRAAVLVKQDGNLLVFEEIQPEGIVSEIVNLLPAMRPAPGQSVTVAKPEPGLQRRPAEDPHDPFASASAPRSRSAPQLRAVERMFDKPKLRIGQFTAFAQDRTGYASPQEPVAWFDTEDGRLFCTSRTAGDGRNWLTYTPADNARITQHLYSQVERFLRR